MRDLFGTAAEGEHQDFLADLHLDGALVKAGHPVTVVRYSKGQYIRGATSRKGAGGVPPRTSLLQGMAWGPGKQRLQMRLSSA
jgi:hypothetical protein